MRWGRWRDATDEASCLDCARPIIAQGVRRGPFDSAFDSKASPLGRAEALRKDSKSSCRRGPWRRIPALPSTRASTGAWARIEPLPRPWPSTPELIIDPELHVRVVDRVIQDYAGCFGAHEMDKASGSACGSG